tara:strand:+ start:604 stop:999 length:396 start_codon:yes stop_codon:yes gene_type:complete
MQEEKDYFQREIQRLAFLLKELIGKALRLRSNNFEQGIQNIESDLKNEFDLTLRELSEMKNSELTKKISGLNELHLEKLAGLITVVSGNSQNVFGKRIAKKGILILEYLDNHTKTFSMKRMELKNTLQQYL